MSQSLATYSGPSADYFTGPERRSYVGIAHRALLAEFIHAWRTGPDTPVRTPGYFDRLSSFGKPTAPLSVVVGDDLGGQTLDELMLIVRDAADGQDVAMRCSALMAALAKEHANYHADALAIELEGDA